MVKTLNNLIFLIERDIECETIIDKLVKDHQVFCSLQKRLLGILIIMNARWQFAHYLIQVKDQEN